MGESMRKQKMKKILSLLAAGVLLLMSMSGCGKEAETGKTQVAMIVKSTESAFFKSVFAGARAAATEYNLNVTFNGPESEEDYVTQNEMVRQAMEDGVDVIVFSAVDYNANAEIIGQAAQRGIKIVVIDSDVNSSMVSCRIGTNNLQAGVKAAEAALAVGEDELYIGIVNYDVNSANGQQRELGFRQTVEQDPRVKDITTINVLSTTEDARAGAKEMLLSDSRINVVVTFNEWTSLGVGWAIRDLDRGDRTQVVAFDSNVVSVGMLETGEVDALIVQDMGITKLNLPPIPLHASTQMDNRTPEKVKFLWEAGFRQVVLARELSIREIRKIHEICPEVPLEVFVHGALCVSYSGQCYVSQACFGRSANRGECAQFCRLPFSLVDSEGKVIVKDKHLLSLKDMNQSDELERLLDAGASSFKIEGRLKDVSYVKNVTAAYRQKLDAIFARRPEYVRASSGTCRFDFKPQLDKSFSRGFTHYFLHGRSEDIFSFDTPKSLGEEMGTMKEARGNFLTVAGLKSFNNGDGVCYIDEQGRLQGFRINRVDGNKLYPQEMPRIKPRTKLYRNFDQEFERILSRKSAERKIAVNILLADNNFGFSLTLTDEDDNSVTLTLPREKEPARTPQADNLKTQLAKLGNTPFEAEKIEISFSENWFLPASVLADFRRQAIEKLIAVRRINYRQELAVWKPTSHDYPQAALTYLGNVMNTRAASFYREHGVQQVAEAYEKERVEDAVLMFCKHCLRYSMGWCPIHQRVRSPYKEPYYLVSNDGKRFRLEFDCKNCQMKVKAAQ